MDLIFVIIRIFSLKNNKQSNNLFDIRNFPNKLNQMLYHFVKLHLTSKQTM